MFSSLGSDLVTNDSVAIIELVKNSYDAFASRVDVRLVIEGDGSSQHQVIEIQDNGSGMTIDIIKNVWCVVATPYRKIHPYSKQQGRTRRVSGDKGLGRLSAARLGNRFTMFTKHNRDQCYQVNVEWDDLSKGDTLEASEVSIQTSEGPIFPDNHGTLIRISELTGTWDPEKIENLREQLARLISPFAGIEDFQIWLSSIQDDDTKPVEIRPHPFLAVPPYMLKGSVNKDGQLIAKYAYNTPQAQREENIDEYIWDPTDVKNTSKQPAMFEKLSTKPECGQFDFEIRVWDIDPESILRLSERFDLNKTLIRKDIKNYHGLSLYRDGILVLPKSDTARDWLGFDLRRVSKVGTRLSTNQMVGYIVITANENKKIIDTSDRERLVENKAFRDFKKMLIKIVSILEDARSKDRQESSHKEPPLADLLSQLSPSPLLEKVNSVAARGGPASDVVHFLDEYGGQVKDTIEEIERRLYYYSRLASLGVLAAMLIHEVRNQTLAIGRFMRVAKEFIGGDKQNTANVERNLPLAERGIQSLERLADRFSPLARRTSKGRQRNSQVESIIKDCIAICEQDIEKKGIKTTVSNTNTEAIIDPGELTAVIINLLENAIYWLAFGKKPLREIRFTIESDEKTNRVFIHVDDSGPGINPGDEERIFWPGVTRKEDGFGMGLTVASEIVSQHGGNMALVKPGRLGGASFVFDLPLKTTN